MPTPLDALCMSYLAYEVPASFSPDATRVDISLNSVFGTRPQPPGSPPEHLVTKIGKIHELVRNGWVYFKMERDSISGYQCVAFVNHTKKEFVLAHRGTVDPFQVSDFKANAKCDVQILSGNRAQLTAELVSLLDDLVAFITQIIRKKKYRIS